MSLGSMFSSPGKQASQAASASGQIADQEISKLMNYTDTHQQQLRDAIGQQGPNPYFAAAQQLDPQAYYTNPQDATTFSAGGPGLTSGQTQVQGNPFAPPPPRIIMSGPTSGTPSQPVSQPQPNPNPNPNPLPRPNPVPPGGIPRPGPIERIPPREIR